MLKRISTALSQLLVTTICRRKVPLPTHQSLFLARALLILVSLEHEGERGGGKEGGVHWGVGGGGQWVMGVEGLR